MVAQFSPFQKDKKADEPSEDLPPAKMLLEFPSSTATAVTGPGRALEFPTADQVLFSIAYIATLDAVPSDSAIEPDANSSSWLSPPKATLAMSP